MTVREMTKALMDLPPDSAVLICAHEFPGMEGTGWFVQAVEPANNDAPFVLIEGASPPPPGAVE